MASLYIVLRCLIFFFYPGEPIFHSSQTETEYIVAARREKGRHGTDSLDWGFITPQLLQTTEKEQWIPTSCIQITSFRFPSSPACHQSQKNLPPKAFIFKLHLPVELQEEDAHLIVVLETPPPRVVQTLQEASLSLHHFGDLPSNEWKSKSHKLLPQGTRSFSSQNMFSFRISRWTSKQLLVQFQRKHNHLEQDF